MANKKVWFDVPPHWKVAEIDGQDYSSLDKTAVQFGNTTTGFFNGCGDPCTGKLSTEIPDATTSISGTFIDENNQQHEIDSEDYLTLYYKDDNDDTQFWGEVPRKKPHMP